MKRGACRGLRIGPGSPLAGSAEVPMERALAPGLAARSISAATHPIRQQDGTAGISG